MPDATYFKPAGIPLKELQEICLSLEETEAIRLKDLENLEQEEGARRMNVSRATFQRMLASARQKIAEAILQGKAIRIDGGNVEIIRRRFRCRNGHEWEIPAATGSVRAPDLCPTCSNDTITAVLADTPTRHRRRFYGGRHPDGGGD